MPTENVLATQATLGMIGAGFLQLLKKSSLVTSITAHSAWLNHAVLVVTAAAGALSIHFAWNASAHSLTITGLDAATMVASIWLWAKQWTVQFLVHRGVFGPVAVPQSAAPAEPAPTKP